MEIENYTPKQVITAKTVTKEIAEIVHKDENKVIVEVNETQVIQKTDTVIPTVKEKVAPVQITDEKQIQDKITNILLKNPIVFRSKSNVLNNESQKTLDDIIVLLQDRDNDKIEIKGYSDVTGDIIFNKVISQKNADLVQRYFKAKGFKNVQSKGYGEDPKNSRIEINITSK